MHNIFLVIWHVLTVIAFLILVALTISSGAIVVALLPLAGSLVGSEFLMLAIPSMMCLLCALGAWVIVRGWYAKTPKPPALGIPRMTQR